MPKRKRRQRRWRPLPEHGDKCNRNTYAAWPYFYRIAKARKLSIAELLERSVALYELNDTPSVKELEEFQADLRGRIKLMEYRIGTSRPTDLDEGLLDFYREVLEDSEGMLR